MTIAAMGSARAQSSKPTALGTGSFFLRPTSDDTNSGSWQGNPSGGALWSQINEVIPDDVVTAISSSGAGNRNFTVFCANPNGILPGDGGVIVRVRHRGDGGPPPAVITVGVEIYSGSTFADATQVQTSIFGIGDNGIWGNKAMILSPESIVSMSDWRDVIVFVSSDNGTPDSISQIEIEFLEGSFKPTV